MDVFDLDSRHPKYQVERRYDFNPEVVTAKICSEDEDVYELVNVAFDWRHTMGGIVVEVAKPKMTTNIKATDLQFDIQLAIEDYMRYPVREFNWL